MAATFDEPPSLAASQSRSPPPVRPVQPDHFYSPDGESRSAPLSPESSSPPRLSPDNDLLASRGIPIFKPSVEEFRDFEAYMNRVECWGMRSGIVKIIPPKEWTDSLPSTLPQLANVRINSPIEHHMLGRAGIFRVQNVVRRKTVSVREWAELCAKDDYRAPAVDEVGLKAAGEHTPHVKRRYKRRTATAAKEGEALMNDEGEDGVRLEDTASMHGLDTPLLGADVDRDAELERENVIKAGQEQPLSARKRRWKTRIDREAADAKRAELDRVFLRTFDPHTAWLPRNTSASDYTPSFCATLERRYWRNCGLGKPPWYGADTAGTLFTDETTVWNVGSLPSALSRLLPKGSPGLPGVNTPYLYFGMWRATFAWHVEDMDLHSINYIHWGAPKHWYAIPQGRAMQLENILRSFFPRDASKCRQFLRHKSFHASPTLLAQQGCRPNVLVQHPGEFVITYPRGYHAGFNLGFNCAESVNFALDSWLDIGRKAQACGCIGDSVRIDVDALLRARREEELAEEAPRSERPSSRPRPKKPKSEGAGNEKPKLPRKRASETSADKMGKKQKVKATEPSGGSPDLAASSSSTVKQKILLKVPRDPGPYPCCLCVSRDTTGLLHVHDPPNFWSGCQNVTLKDALGRAIWMAHEKCAMVVPETWVDEQISEAGQTKKIVFGVDAVVRDRWALKCSLCQGFSARGHGAPIQCTKGKCPKSFHISCARDGGQESRIQFTELREVEKEVVFVGEHLELPTALIDDTHTVPGVDPPGNCGAIEPTLSSVPTLISSARGGNEAHSQPNVVKTIKKIDYELLCMQHNPVVVAARRASKIDRIRNDLLALPPMSRVKLRVSSGVFEVSLLSVNEEHGTVEVIWDHGIKREFKWSSLVWGKTEGQTVGQKPNVAVSPLEQFDSPKLNVRFTPGYGSRSVTPIPVRQASSSVLTTQNQPHFPQSAPYSSYTDNSSSGRARYDSQSTSYYPIISTASASSANVNSSSITAVPETEPPHSYFNSTVVNQPAMASLTWQPRTVPNQSGIIAAPLSQAFAQTVASSVASLPPRTGLTGSNVLPSQPLLSSDSTHATPAPSSAAPDPSLVATSDSTARPVPAPLLTGGTPSPEVMHTIEELKRLSSLDAANISEMLKSHPTLMEAVAMLIAQGAVQVPAQAT